MRTFQRQHGARRRRVARLQQQSLADRALRTVDRLRLSGDLSDEDVADLVRDIRLVHETLAIHPLLERVLQRAGESLPTAVGTLDAIHLATALAIREAEAIDLLLTHDGQLATAARSVGFTVVGVS